MMILFGIFLGFVIVFINGLLIFFGYSWGYQEGYTEIHNPITKLVLKKTDVK